MSIVSQSGCIIVRINILDHIGFVEGTQYRPLHYVYQYRMHHFIKPIIYLYVSVSLLKHPWGDC